MQFIKKEKQVIKTRKFNKTFTWKGFGIFNSKNNKKVAVINLMGNIFMKKAKMFLKQQKIYWIKLN